MDWHSSLPLPPSLPLSPSLPPPSLPSLPPFQHSIGVSRCIEVDNEQTLNDLLDLLSIDTLNAIVAWLTVYWWIAIIVIIAILVLFILLQATYRKRAPLKRRFSRARNSLRRNSLGGGASGGRGQQVEGGRGGGGGGGRGRRRREDGRRQISPGPILVYIPNARKAFLLHIRLSFESRNLLLVTQCIVCHKKNRL